MNMQPPASAMLATFVADTAVLPEAVSERAALHVADTVACIYAGSRSAAAARVSDLYSRAAGTGGYPVPGLGRWQDAAAAALITGVCAHAEDFDDTSEFSMSGHPSAPVVSAVLATAAATGAGGAQILRAYAVGVELACKLGRTVAPDHAARGWHTMSTLGAVGAAAACANLRGLDAGSAERALGIVVSLAGGVLGNTGTMVKSLHCGHAAWAGFTAAALASADFTSGLGIIEAPRGFLAVFGRGAATDLTPLHELGTPWDLLVPGIAIKLYPSCSCSHPPIDGALRLRSAPGFSLDGVQAVRCWVSEECAGYLVCHEPRTVIEGKFSIEYTVACALARGHVALSDFRGDAVKRADVAGLMPRIALCVRKPSGSEPDIEIVYSDGRTLEAGRGASRGDDRIGWSEVSAKLRDCSCGIVDDAAASKLADDLRRLGSSRALPGFPGTP